MNKMATTAFGVGLFLSGGAVNADDGLGSNGKYANCSSSAAVALNEPCRVSTLQGADRQILSKVQQQIKFDEGRYSKDADYKSFIDKSATELQAIFERGVEISDEAGLFGDLTSSDGGLSADRVIEALRNFPAEHAGCNFTLQKSGVVPFSRSFIVSYIEDDKWKFAVVHIGIKNPEQLNAEPPSSRAVELSSIKTLKLVPGFRNSNALLRTHIVLQATRGCREGILKKMDANIIRALELEAIQERGGQGD